MLLSNIHSHCNSYLTVDYERSQFYISQTQFVAGANEHIITIPSSNSTAASSSQSSHHGLSTGAIAGIAIACFLVGIGVVGGILFLLKRRRSKKVGEAGGDSGYPPDTKDQVDGFGKAELDAGDTASPGHEMGGKAIEYFQPDKVEVHEVSSPVEPQSPLPPPSPDPVYEMTGEGLNLSELPASTVRPHEVG
jgi:hypothetical protein